MVYQPDTPVRPDGNSHAAKLPIAKMLDRLQGVDHVLVNDERGCHLQARNQSLLGIETGTAVGFSRCMEPVMRRLLQDDGYQIHGAAPVESLPQPDYEAVRSHAPIDDGVLEIFQHHDRGIVRIGTKADPAWLIAQIALAFPSLSIVVAVARINDAKAVASALRHWLPDDVLLARTDRIRRDPSRIMVGTYTALQGACMDLHRREILIALDAVDVLGKRGSEVLHAAENARLLGFLTHGRHVAPRDSDHLRGLFGFQEIHVPAHGYQPLTVDVVLEQIVGGNLLPAALDGLDLQRKAVWQNELFNRRVAQLARALDDQDQQGLRTFKRVAQAVSGRRANRPVVLVGNIEHALALARELPGWRLAVGATVHMKGMNRPDRRLLKSATDPSGDNQPAIHTMATVDQVDPRDIDVLIRADAGAGLPPIKQDLLAIPNGTDHRLLLVDFDDRRHHELGRRTRKRRRAYRERGWHSPGADPVQERVKDFLAIRPQTSKA